MLPVFSVSFFSFAIDLSKVKEDTDYFHLIVESAIREINGLKELNWSTSCHLLIAPL